MNKDMGLLDIVLVIAKHKKLIIVITILAAIGAVIYAMLTPFYWKSTATLVPLTESNAIGGFNTNLLDMVGGGFIKTQKSEQAIDYVAIMKSRTMREKVIQEFDLIKYFKITKPADHALELALFRLQNSVMRIDFDQESYLVSVSAETKDKTLSRNIVQFYLDELEHYNKTIRHGKGKLKREFLESQVNDHMKDADSLGLALRDFQVRNKSIALDQQTNSLVSLYGESVASYMKAEIEYDLAQNQYSASSPIVQELAEKKRLLADKLKALEDSNSTLTPKYVIQIDKIPDINRQYAQLMINIEIKKRIIEYLYPQFELAKLEELRETPSFQVIDAPREAGMRSKPKRAVLVIVITMAAFVFALMLALIAESIDQNREIVDKIKKSLLGKQ